MPNKTITIQINTTAELKGLNDLIDKIEMSQKMLNGFGKGVTEFDKFSKGINSLVSSMERLNTMGRANPLGRLNTNLIALNKTIGNMGQGQAQFNKLVKGVDALVAASQKIQNVENLGLDKLAGQLRAVGDAAAAIGTEGARNFSSLATGIDRIVKAAQNAQATKGSFAELSRGITSLSTASAKAGSNADNFQKMSNTISSIATTMGRINEVKGTSINAVAEGIANLARASATIGTDDATRFDAFVKSIGVLSAVLSRLGGMENANLDGLARDLSNLARAGATFGEGSVTNLKNMAGSLTTLSNVTSKFKTGEGGGLGQLATSLNAINRAVGRVSGDIGNFDALVKSLTQLAGTATKLSSLNEVNLTSIANDIGALGRAARDVGGDVTGFEGLSRALERLVGSTAKLGGLREGALQQFAKDIGALGRATRGIGEQAGFEGLARGIGSLVGTTAKLGDMKGAPLTRLANSLEALGRVTTGIGQGKNFDTMSQGISRIVGSLGRLDDIKTASLSHLAIGLQDLARSSGMVGNSVKHFDTLAKSISSVVNSVGKISNTGGLTTMAQGLRQIADASKGVGTNIRNFETLAKSLGTLSTSAARLDGLKNINLGKISNDLVDLAAASQLVGSSVKNFTALTKGISTLASSTQRFAGFKKFDLGSLTLQLSSLSQVAQRFQTMTNFEGFANGLRSLSQSMAKINTLKTGTITNLTPNLIKLADAGRQFGANATGFNEFSTALSRLAAAMSKIGSIQGFDMAGMNRGLRSSAQVLSQFTQSATNFAQFATGVAQIGKAMEKVAASGPAANTQLQEFVNIVRQLDQALQGVPINLQALAQGLRNAARATQVLNNANQTKNQFKEQVESVKEYKNWLDQVTKRVTTKSIWGIGVDDMGNQFQELKETLTMIEKIKNGKVVSKTVTSDKDIQNVNRLAQAHTQLSKSVQSVTSPLRVVSAAWSGVGTAMRGISTVAQTLSGIFNSLMSTILGLSNRLTNLANSAIRGSLGAISNFSRSASAQFANLSKSMSAAGGFFQRFEKHVRDSMQRSQQEVMKFYQSGWSFIASGYMLQNAGRGVMGRIDRAVDQYTEYERSLTRAAIAGAQSFTAEGLPAGPKDIPVSYTVDPRAVEEMIFGMQRGQYGPSIRQFDAQTVAEGAYVFAAAVGKAIDQETMPLLAPVLTDIAQVANITRTSPEAVTKGVVNAATEFGIDVRDPRQWQQLGDMAADLAYAANVTTLEFPDLAETFKMVGPMANMLGVTFDDALAYTMELSDFGLRGSQVGRGLSMTLSRLLDPTKEMQGIAADVFGVEESKAGFQSVFFDAQGKLEGGLEGFIDKVMKSVPADKAAFLIADLFTENATRNTVAAVQAQMKDQGRYSFLRNLIQSDAPQDYLAAAIKANNETLGAALQNFENAWFQITSRIIDNVKGPFMDALDGIADVLFRISDVVADNPAVSQFFVGLASAIGIFLSVAGGLFTAFGSLLLVAKALAMVQGSGFGFIRIMRDIAALVRTITPTFILLSAATAAVAAVWNENLGGMRDAIQGLDIGNILEAVTNSMTRNLKMVGGAWYEFIRLMLSGGGSISNLLTFLDRVFGDILGPIAFGHIMDLVGAFDKLKGAIGGAFSGLGGADIGTFIGSIGGALQGLIEQALTGTTSINNIKEVQNVFKAIFGEDWSVQFTQTAKKINTAIGYIISYVSEMYNILLPMFRSIGENLSSIFGQIDLSPLEMLRSFLIGFVGGFSATIITIVRAIDALTEALAGLSVVRMLTEHFNSAATAAGALAGVISGALLIGAITPGIGGILHMGAAVADLAIKYGVLGTATLAFRAIAITTQAVIAVTTAIFTALGAILTGTLTAGFGSIIVLLGLVGVAFYGLWQQSEQFRLNIMTIVNNGGPALMGFLNGFWQGMQALLNVVGAVVYVIADLAASFVDWSGAADTAYAAGFLVAAAFGAIAVASIAATWEIWLIVAAVVGLLAVLQKLGILDDIGNALKAVFDGIVERVQNAINAIESLARYAADLFGWIHDQTAKTRLEIIPAEMSKIDTQITNMVGGGVDKYVSDKMADVENDPYLRSLYRQEHGGQTPMEGDINKWVDATEEAAKNIGEVGRFTKYYTDMYRNDPVIQQRLSAVDSLQRQKETLANEQYRLEHGGESVKDTIPTAAAKDVQDKAEEVNKTISDAAKGIDLGGLTDLFGGLLSGNMGPKEIMGLMGWDMPDVTKMFGTNSLMNIDPRQFQLEAIDQVKDEYIKQAYKQRTGQSIYRDATGNWQLDMVEQGGYTSTRGQAAIGPNGEVIYARDLEHAAINATALAGAEEDAAAAMTEAEKAAAAKAAADQRAADAVTAFAQSIQQISFDQVLEGLYGPLAGRGGMDAAGVLQQYSGTILQNLQDTLGKDATLPWQNEFELMMDAAGTGGNLGQNLAGKNLREALRPYLETFAAQSGVDIESLMKDIPMFQPGKYTLPVAQGDLMQAADAMTRGTYEKLDLFGSQADAITGQIYDAEGFDWTEIANYASAQAEAGFKDWNLTDYIMEAWDLTKEQAEAYIKQNGLTPDIINATDFADTQLYANALGGQVNVMTPEWLAYLEKVTQGGTDKTIEITQAAFDQLPDIVKIGYSNMGYQFVIGGEQTNNQLISNAQMMHDQLLQTYGTLPDQITQMLKPITEGGGGGYSEVVDGVLNVYDSLGNLQFTMPAGDYSAWIESNNTLENEKNRLQTLKDELWQLKEDIRNLSASKDVANEQSDMGGPMASGVGFGLYAPVSQLDQLKQDANDIREDLGWLTPENLALPDLDWSKMLPEPQEAEAVKTIVEGLATLTKDASLTEIDWTPLLPTDDELEKIKAVTAAFEPFTGEEPITIPTLDFSTMFGEEGETPIDKQLEMRQEFAQGLLDFKTSSDAVLNLIGDSLPNHLSVVVQPAATTAAFNINNAVTNEFVGMRNNIDNIVANVGATIVGQLNAAAGPAGSAAFNLGSVISAGIANGINAGIESIRQAAANAVSAARAAGGEQAQEGSPARWFMPLGENMGLGVAIGIEDAIPANEEAMSRLVGAAGTVPTNTPVANAGTRGGGDEIHFHIENLYVQDEETLVRAVEALDERLGEKFLMVRRGMTAVSEKE